MLSRFFELIFSVIYQCILKIMYGNRINLGSKHHTFKNFNQIIVKRNSKMKIGSVRMNTNSLLASVNGGDLYIGNNVGINRNVAVICKDSIRIENGVSIGPNVCIYDHDHYFDKNGFSKSNFKTAPVIIGENTWIGAGAIILRGTHIGKNCVIAAGTIVKGDIPERSLVKSNRNIEIEQLR